MALTPEKVLALVTRFGVDGTFRTYPSSSYSHATGKATLGTPVDHTHKILPPFAAGSGEAERYGLVDGVPEADLFTVVSSSGMSIVPVVGMELLYQSKVYSIVGITAYPYKTQILGWGLALKTKAD